MTALRGTPGAARRRRSPVHASLIMNAYTSFGRLRGDQSAAAPEGMRVTAAVRSISAGTRRK
jgi:hypothetical protein